MTSIQPNDLIAGSFVVEYAGDLVTRKEANKRELKYTAEHLKMGYTFHFKHKDKNFW